MLIDYHMYSPAIKQTPLGQGSSVHSTPIYRLAWSKPFLDE